MDLGIGIDSTYILLAYITYTNDRNSYRMVLSYCQLYMLNIHTHVYTLISANQRANYNSLG